MIDCRTCNDLLAWYVKGALPPEEARDAADHLAACAPCREALASTLSLATEIQAAFQAAPRVPREAWQKVARGVRSERRARIDPGSFYAGLALGLRVRSPGSPVFGDLVLLGRRVPLFRIGEGGYRERRTSRRGT